jgi:hypothetical protein
MASSLILYIIASVFALIVFLIIILILIMIKADDSAEVLSTVSFTQIVYWIIVFAFAEFSVILLGSFVNKNMDFHW